ncbi:uncharacterized protein TNCV_4587801 [Trichonephila clavipes]|uniref:Uncharacterized protein n=1 Tax=Trichonephila clavipes TaxID=2585209 RepID=A0A8X6RY07_TRICX|nr:uncharacterized protein TNCV_4587801 [Trichonephila clavipes]
MTTTSYRGRAAVGVRHLFSVEELPCCPVASWCTRNDDNDILPRRTALGVRHLFPSRHYSAVRSLLGARGTMTTTTYRGHATKGVRIPFSVEALLCCLVPSWCTRKDDNDILPQPLGGGCSSLFSSRHNSTVRSRLGARGTMSTFMLPRPRGAGLFVKFFPSRHYSAVRSRLGARGTMITKSYRVRAAVGVRHLFPSRHYSAVRSHLGARGTMTTITYRGHSAVGVRPFFPSRHNSGVRSRLGARGTMTTTSYRGIQRWVFVPFFRRGTTLLSGRVLVHAER